jgi:hypothetical protein
MQMRFGMAGLLSNAIFMVLYNGAVVRFDELYAASTIYSLVYFCFIPISHALTSLLVFGWPTHYLSSLLNNYPIGLTAIALGAACTAYFDKIGFNESVEDFIRDTMGLQVRTDADEKGEFYSSLVVMVITSIWSYVLSVAVNAPSDDKHKTLPLKKEL